ncbi:MAG TPA: alpha-amylase family glycosyl hydrolase [Anaerolineales bacterium]|nr:alpha-amylase family glycosyl hydrolase [Anaerolineales bacterium]
MSSYPMLEFHISRKARDRYQFDLSLFALSGNVILANFHAARQFAQKINQQRDLINYPERAVQAGQINAMGLLDEILHLVISQYRQQHNPQMLAEAMTWLDGMLGENEINQTLQQFIDEFPPLEVYTKSIPAGAYLLESSDGVPNRQLVLEELLVLWLSNMNPALSPYMELFDDSQLVKQTAYTRLISLLHAYFETQPPYGPDHQNLIDMLRSPAIAVPHSLEGQLEYIRQRWGLLLGKYLYKLLSSLDLIKEEQRTVFFGPGPARVYDFTGAAVELERFSPDKDWMPSLVLMAKNAYVWLDQLAKRYKRTITRLDQVPDEELDALARWGFTGLWLIGLWERSTASKTIKQMRGNPDAVASAYSLFDYQIAAELGGDEAYQNLHDRAWQRGIRLASDMVPNHMGIDSRWVVEHPDWFVSLNYSPFPSYSFNGPNLSGDNRVGLYIEDHYFDNTDAAVVFKRVDFWNGSEQYIYHGNDGTSMPWNDTAQINFLKPEVREAVIQTILHVARKFPVIRFDAAMTLAKKHYQRLWFPEPGTGGAIPSRAEHGLTKDQFDAAIPVEFWREVVDRVAQEVPDTLLLAEAFWLMEGYFVRTLGMHRVYNSAFMNMLRDEKNAEYRQAIKNTLEFDPEILKRYVNFMNNPDERTAVEQFGKGDKYFGICTLMATLPGLPMFGHGQIEGFTEKYGMEYHRAYWDEQEDSALIERHQREIFPVLRKRYLFAEVANFLLYDVYTPDGHVNEDVFAYSNQAGSEKALVVYHNKFANAQGWIRTSAAYSVKTDSGERMLVQKRLGEGLGLVDDDQTYSIFTDLVSGMEYIRNNREMHEKGLFVELEAYKFRVFINFLQVQDNEWHQYGQLTSYLNGRGVPSIDDAMREIFLQPIHHAFRECANAAFFRWVITNRQLPISDQTKVTGETMRLSDVLEEAEDKFARLFSEIKQITHSPGDSLDIAAVLKRELNAAMNMPAIADNYPLERSRKYRQALKFLNAGSTAASPWSNGDPRAWGVLLSWLCVHRLGQIVTPQDHKEISRSWVDEWLLNKLIASSMMDLGLEERSAWQSITLIKLLIGQTAWWENPSSDFANRLLVSIFSDTTAQNYLGVNRYKGILWFNREAFDDLLWWLNTIAIIDCAANESSDQIPQTVIKRFAVIQKIQQASLESNYQVEKLLAAVREI